MSSSKGSFKASWSLLVVVGVVVALVAACRKQTAGSSEHDAAPAAGAASVGAAATPSESATQPPAADGMKAYVDPQTGRLTDTPPPGAELLPGDVLAPPGTVVERPAAGGGTVLDMRRRKSDPAAEPEQ